MTPTSEKTAPSLPRLPVNTDVIVSKNLFDPERGAGATREAEENSRAFQRVRSMILIGTMIIGNNRVAILQDGNPTTSAGQRNPAPTASTVRLKIGDDVEGFRLTEIADRKVVFARDTARVEVLLDYFRKVETPSPPKVVPPTPAGAPPPPAVPVPRVVPNLPRRGQIPVPTNPAPES